MAMRNRSTSVFAVAVGLLIVSGPLSAHHSNAIFEAGKRVVMTGTVTEWFWANPHCLLSVDVKGVDGQMVQWVVETQAPPNMIPFGWSRQSFKTGDHVTITVEPARSGRPVGRLLRAVLPDGRELVAGAGLPPGPSGGTAR
jgi:hypothetical protein